MNRINIKEIDPDSYKAMLGLEQYIRNSQIAPQLRELIKIRASQIDGAWDGLKGYITPRLTKSFLPNSA